MAPLGTLGTILPADSRSRPREPRPPLERRTWRPTLRDHRPRLHLTPPGNWLNDPNGLFYRDGRLHVTYQHNPDEPRWGRMHWAHAVSDDLMTWRQLPIALSPDEGGADAFGCWSGCILDRRDEAVMFYTGARLDGDLRRQAVCSAASRDPDRISWRKDAANPVIAAPPAGIEPDLFRDPFVWPSGSGWTMLVGAGTQEGEGTVLRYRSSDLRRWEYAGPILAASDIDRTAGADGPMWECPQLLQMGDVDVLVISVVDRAPGIRPSHVMALVGKLGEDGFSVERAQRLGMGPDFYAPASARTPDGRWLILGWIPEDPPAPGEARTWAGSLTFPRIVSLRRDGSLSLALAEEVAAARGPVPELARTVDLRPGPEPEVVAVPDEPFELCATLVPGEDSEVAIELNDGDPTDPIARIVYRADERLLSIARRGIVTVAGRSSRSATTLSPDDGEGIRLRIIVDGSVLELEANGHTMATVRLSAPHQGPRVVAFAATEGSTQIDPLEVWSLRARESRGARHASLSGP